jgi:adenylate cyclase
VNLGSRLEGLTKKYGVDIVVSAATAALVPDLAFREIDRVRVKGKQEPIAIFEPLGPRAGLTEALQLAAARFAEVLARYRTQAWNEAETMLSELAARDGQVLYALYLERIRHFRANPPPTDWDGVFTFETK